MAPASTYSSLASVLGLGWLLLLPSLLPSAGGWKFGTPTNACFDMMPRHERVKENTPKCPYKLELQDEATTYIPGETLTGKCRRHSHRHPACRRSSNAREISNSILFTSSHSRYSATHLPPSSKLRAVTLSVRSNQSVILIYRDNWGKTTHRHRRPIRYISVVRSDQMQ